MQRHCRSVYLSPHHRQRRICMVTDVLFHPDHVIPPPELIAALMEFAHHPVAQLFVEPDAVPCQIGVAFAHRAGDAGVHIEEMPPPQFLFQGIVEQSADATAFLVLFHLDGSLPRPVIGSTVVKFSGVGIAHRHAVLLCHQIGVFF